MKKKSLLILGSILICGLALGYFRFVRHPMVSVVMLTYQRADLLPKSIESILNQTYKDFELIIVNDGATDNTDEVIGKYKDRRIKYYKNEKNMGIPYSRERATSLARGKYVMIMDDDDRSLLDRMEKQVQYLETHPDITAVAGQIVNMPLVPKTHDEIVLGMIQYNNFGNANIMYRRDFTQKHGIKYDEKCKVSEDWNYWIDMLFSGAKFAGMNESVLLRNSTSEKHYHTTYAKYDDTVRKNIGHHFSPEDPEAFYKADRCQKISFLEKYKLLSKGFIQGLRQTNCPQP